jgi:hypothetical protein
MREKRRAVGVGSGGCGLREAGGELFRLLPEVPCRLFEPFRRQGIETALRQPFGSRRLLAEILNPAHGHILTLGQFEAKPFVPGLASVWLMGRKIPCRGSQRARHFSVKERIERRKDRARGHEGNQGGEMRKTRAR